MDPLPIKNTRQIYSAAIEIIGMACLAKIYGPVKQRQIYRWAANPDFCEDTQRNPLDRIIALIRQFNELGRRDVSRAVASMVCAAAGTEQRLPAECHPDKPTLSEECLDDLPELARYHRVLNDPEATEQEVRTMKEKAIRELDENEAFWMDGKK